MYSFFSTFPYVRLLIYWVLGTLMSRYIPLWAWWPLASAGLCICLFQSEFLLAILLITLSVFRYNQVQISSRISPDLSSRSCVFQVDAPPIEKARTFTLTGRAIALRDQGIWKPASGFWRVYMEKTADAPKRGDKYLVSGYLNPIAEAQFPVGMNWRAYYAQKGIGGQMYVKKDAWVRLAKSDFSLDFLVKTQIFLREALRRALPAGVNRDVAEAMFLGVSNSIDFETMQRYASLGAIHILSVSGLHVGFLYLGLAFLFGFLRKWKLLYFLVILLFLWAYAGMTGFSGPVLRSVWMFSVMLGAKAFRLNQQPLNTLAFSCLVLLIWDPQNIFQVGFQLSYAAVLGLILFQGALKKMFSSRYWLVNQVWDLTCVAIAAQLLTWPLVLYYFHQFPHPFYFFLVNPVLIVLSTITLAVGFIYLSLCFLDFTWLGHLLNFCFQCFHGFLFSVADYVNPAIPLLQVDLHEIFAYYAFLLVLYMWWSFRKIHFLFLGMGIVSGIFWLRMHWVPMNRLFLTVHGGQAVVVHEAGAHGLVYGRQLNPGWVQSNIIPLFAASRVQDTITRALPRAWSFEGHSFYRVDKPCKPLTLGVSDLIIESSLSFQDLRWLVHWPNAHWYFVRRPSAYRLRQIRGFSSGGITFLNEVPAIQIKKAAFVRQPILN